MSDHKLKVGDEVIVKECNFDNNKIVKHHSSGYETLKPGYIFKITEISKKPSEESTVYWENSVSIPGFYGYELELIIPLSQESIKEIDNLIESFNEFLE